MAAIIRKPWLAAVADLIAARCAGSGSRRRISPISIVLSYLSFRCSFSVTESDFELFGICYQTELFEESASAQPFFFGARGSVRFKGRHLP